MSLVLIISAPSGSGKSTLVKRLMDSDRNLTFSTSVTTRPPRAGEVDGESYHFIGVEDFLRRRDNDELLEWAEVFGNYYGTTRSVLERAHRRGLDLVLDIDVQGAAQLKEKLPGAVTVFYCLPPARSWRSGFAIALPIPTRSSSAGSETPAAKLATTKNTTTFWSTTS